MPCSLESALNNFPLLRDRKHSKKTSWIKGVGRTPGKDTNHRARVQGHAESNLALELRVETIQRWKPAEPTVDTGPSPESCLINEVSSKHVRYRTWGHNRPSFSTKLSKATASLRGTANQQMFMQQVKLLCHSGKF